MMDVYEAIYTTRAMRRLEPDPIPPEVLPRLFDAAIRGPNSGTPNSSASCVSPTRR